MLTRIVGRGCHGETETAILPLVGGNQPRVAACLPMDVVSILCGPKAANEEAALALGARVSAAERDDRGEAVRRMLEFGEKHHPTHPLPFRGLSG
jgi:hypothetical protein